MKAAVTPSLAGSGVIEAVSSETEDPSHRGDPNPVTVSADVTEPEWDRFVEQHPRGTVEHLWRWRAVFQNVFGHDCVYLAARRQDTVVGILPLVRYRSPIFGRFIVSLPYFNYAGVLAIDQDAVAGLVEHALLIARAHGAKHLELRHRERQLLSLPYRQNKLGFRRELPSSVEGLWSGVDRKVRNQVRKAQKEGLTTAIGREELLDEFYQVFSENMRDLGTPVFPRSLFSETARHFPNQMRVFVVRDGTQPAAAGIALTFRGTVLVPWASSLRRFRQRAPNMLLYWAMLEWAVEQQLKVFDFGRSSIGAGTQQFKEQWGGTAFPLHTEYAGLGGNAIPDHGTGNPRMQLAIAVWQRLPLAVANLVGPSLIRQLS